MANRYLEFILHPNAYEPIQVDTLCEIRFRFLPKSLATVQQSCTEAVDIDGGIQMGKEITTDGGWRWHFWLVDRICEEERESLVSQSIVWKNAPRPYKRNIKLISGREREKKQKYADREPFSDTR